MVASAIHSELSYVPIGFSDPLPIAEVIIISSLIQAHTASGKGSYSKFSNDLHSGPSFGIRIISGRWVVKRNLACLSTDQSRTDKFSP